MQFCLALRIAADILFFKKKDMSGKPDPKGNALVFILNLFEKYNEKVKFLKLWIVFKALYLVLFKKTCRHKLNLVFRI